MAQVALWQGDPHGSRWEPKGGGARGTSGNRVLQVASLLQARGWERKMFFIKCSQ